MSVKKYADFLRQKLENIPFSEVIKITTGHKVQPLSSKDNKVINEIYDSAKNVLDWSRDIDFSGMRPNEISNKLERELRNRLGGQIPQGKMAGYPDILIMRGKAKYYVEVKLADEEQLDSNFRTFYYEPVEPTKVTEDAHHVLVGYVHRGKRIIGFKIVDLSEINVSLKNEFNASNKELYKRDAVIREYPSQPTLV